MKNIAQDSIWYTKYMAKKVLNYRIIVEQEKKGKSRVFVAYCPALGISDEGTTVDEAVMWLEKAIKLNLEVLRDLGEDIPESDEKEFVILNKKFTFNTTASVPHA